MNKYNFILIFWLTVIRLSFAVIPSIENLQKVVRIDEPDHLSLPNLLKLNSINDLELNWETFSNIKLDTGRLIIDKSVGGIWSIPTLANTPNEWTIELVSRSSGTSKNDLVFSDINGLSLWLIDPSNSLPINSKNMDNFGGPSKFDGFQFLINNKDVKGIKIFNNDGSKVLRNSISESIGKCEFNYLDSSVPFTLRISYSKAKNWFKVQIDNNLCFKTDQIVIPDSVNDFKFGVTGSISPSSQEFFEILRLSIWNHLTDDAIDDHGLMTNGQIKVEYKTVTQEQQSYVPPSYIRESLMERNRRHKEDLLSKQSEELEIQPSSDVSLSQIFKKIDQLESVIRIIESNGQFDFKNIENKVLDIKTEQIQLINNLQKDFNEFKQSVINQYSEILVSISKLNEKVIGEVREQQYTIDELSNKVDLLMNNHKEISYQYDNMNKSNNSDMSNFMNSIIKWILIPVIIGIIILTIFVYRLRHDIKHSKLL